MKKTAILVAALILIPALTLGSVLFLLRRAEAPEEESTVVEVSEEESFERQSEPDPAESSANEESSEEDPDAPSDIALFDFTEIEDGSYEVMSKIDAELPERIVIPSLYNGKAVTRIANYAFANRSLIEVVLPQCVTEIGEFAFAECFQLERVELKGVINVENHAFSSCAALTEIVLPPCAEEIGSDAFWNCGSLQRVKITSDTIRFIGSSAFAECDKLEYKEYGNALYLGDEDNPYRALIKATSEDIESVEINENAVIIAQSAFVGCSRLAELTVPQSVKSINANAFHKCDLLKTVILPEGVILGKLVFASCAALERVELSEGIKEIPERAFYKCTSLAEIIIPEGVTSIGDRAFFACTALERVDVPDSVEKIGIRACAGSKITDINIPKSMIRISDCAFQACFLASAVIPEGVSGIGNEAFYGSALRSVYIPESVTDIGDSAFAVCRLLKDVFYAGTIAQWRKIAKGENWDDKTPDYTVHCSDGNAAKQKENVTPDNLFEFFSVGDGSYEIKAADVHSLPAEITIPSEINGLPVSTLSSLAFHEATALKSVIIPPGVINIGHSAFASCSSLVNVNVPEGVTSLRSVFLMCEALKEINIPASVEDITSAFAFSGLTDAELPEGLKTIGENAFMSCHSLSQITIPASVTQIEPHAFYDCSALEAIFFAGTVEQWNDIKKLSEWDEGTPSFTVHCSDGEIEVKTNR